MIEPLWMLIAGYFPHFMGGIALLLFLGVSVLFVSSPRKLNRHVDRFDPRSRWSLRKSRHFRRRG